MTKRDYKISDFGKYLLEKEPSVTAFLDTYKKSYENLLKVLDSENDVSTPDFIQMKRVAERQLANNEMELKRRLPTAFSNFLVDIMMRQIRDESDKNKSRKVE